MHALSLLLLPIAVSSTALVKRQNAVIELYHSSASCGGSSTSMSLVPSECTPVQAESAKQNQGDNGIKFSCTGYNDQACTSKVGEVDDCLDYEISSILCVENPPL